MFSAGADLRLEEPSGGNYVAFDAATLGSNVTLRWNMDAADAALCVDATNGGTLTLNDIGGGVYTIDCEADDGGGGQGSGDIESVGFSCGTGACPLTPTWEVGDPASPPSSTTWQFHVSGTTNDPQFYFADDLFRVNTPVQVLSATPGIYGVDTAAPLVQSFLLDSNCTTTTGGSEDCPLTLYSMVDGSAYTVLAATATGAIQMGNADIVYNPAVSGNSRLTVPDDSIGAAEILDTMAPLWNGMHTFNAEVRFEDTSTPKWENATGYRLSVIDNPAWTVNGAATMPECPSGACEIASYPLPGSTNDLLYRDSNGKLAALANSEVTPATGEIEVYGLDVTDKTAAPGNFVGTRDYDRASGADTGAYCGGGGAPWNDSNVADTAGYGLRFGDIQDDGTGDDATDDLFMGCIGGTQMELSNVWLNFHSRSLGSPLGTPGSGIYRCLNQAGTSTVYNSVANAVAILSPLDPNKLLRIFKLTVGIYPDANYGSGEKISVLAITCNLSSSPTATDCTVQGKIVFYDTGASGDVLCTTGSTSCFGTKVIFADVAAASTRDALAICMRSDDADYTADDGTAAALAAVATVEYGN